MKKHNLFGRLLAAVFLLTGFAVGAQTNAPASPFDPANPFAIGLDQLWSVLRGDYGLLAQITGWMGTLRVVCKVFSGHVQAFFERALARIAETSDTEDDSLAERLLRWWGYRLFAFLVDMATSIKLPLQLRSNASAVPNGSTLAVLLCAAGLAALTTGCVSTPAGGSSIPPERMAVIAELAAYNGGTLYLQQRPESRPHFEASLAALALLQAGQNATPADVQAALAKLPIRELNSPQGQVAVGSAVILYDAFVREHVNLDHVAWLRPVVDGLHRGLARALAATASTPAE